MGRCNDWTRSIPPGMKAQSGLAGDRKRRAEMARPRISGVTNRITGITESMDKAFETIRATELSCVPKITVAPALTQALESLSEKKLYDTEVNNCPAGQQCPVCTP